MTGVRSLHARWKTGEGWLRVIGGAGERWWSGDVKWQMRVEGRGIQGERGGRGERRDGVEGWEVWDGGCKRGDPR